ncbi:MAG: YHS domain-containing protein [Planctomycetes bacterium]|nr:YHS domain-containing protein [Planctomycetota bacterium]
MCSLDSFTARIRAELEAAERASENSDRDAEYMTKLKERTERFRPLIRSIIDGIVRPRLEKVAAFFPNAAPPRKVDPAHCTWWFGYCERFPASVKLDLSCGHDEDVRSLYVIQELRMTPSFTTYDRFERLAQPLDDVDLETVTTWVEDRLTAFVHAYLQLEAADRQQCQGLATDPVCHMRIVKDDAAGHLDYRGHRFYFCAPSCRDEFAADPERFAKIEMEP